MHRANSVRHADSMNTGGLGGGAGQSNTTSLLNKFAANHQRSTSDKSTTNVEQTKSTREASKKSPPPASNDDNNNAIVSDSQSQKQQRQQQQQRHQDQSVQPQQVYLKSCLSDGDFNEILIKVNDDQDDSQIVATATRAAQYLLDQKTEGDNSLSADPNDDLANSKNRRRSSCSDAKNSKLSIGNK